MNKIIRPISGCEKLGFDEFGQLCAWTPCPSGTGEIGVTVPDLRGQKCFICGMGWEVTPESFKNYQRFDVGSHLLTHKTCYKKHLQINQMDFFSGHLADIFSKQHIFWRMRETKNEYGGGWNLPWYKIEFKQYIPALTLGFRKHVYELTLADLTEAQYHKFNELFEPVQSTKGTNGHGAGCFVYVHAHTKDEFVEHLKRFLQIVEMDKPFETAELTADRLWKPGCPKH